MTSQLRSSNDVADFLNYHCVKYIKLNTYAKFHDHRHNNNKVRDGPLFFFWGGVTIFGTCRQFFLKSNALQTIFFVTFCSENIFFMTLFRKCYRLFYRSYLGEKHFLCMHTHESFI